MNAAAFNIVHGNRTASKAIGYGGSIMKTTDAKPGHRQAWGIDQIVQNHFTAREKYDYYLLNGSKVRCCFAMTC